MDKTILEFVTWAESNGWIVTLKSESDLDLDHRLITRYTNIPAEYRAFLSAVNQCMTPSEQTWFLCEADYNNRSDSEFHWNEYELISLDAAMDDEAWRSEITSWWDQYLPIMMSVRDGYSFYAIDLSNETGAVVYGEEPEFEEVNKVADNLHQFLQRIMSDSIKL
ncbi:SMI1/KNR4 family protein [Paenibacillus xylanexedens]|uniref:SMI1/KNR4 family protein n=1 Tax=Paenibacillus xylanexedens TaxID=528191 RepID=UPI0011AB2AD4|nr:SMI1/KNR4 family protein [Paenibacillus xylanexedens]